MAYEMKVASTACESADLTLTNEYMVVKGPHYLVCNGYISSSKAPQAIKVKDIMSIEYVTMRSKRLLMVFVVLMTILLCCGSGIKFLSSAIVRITQETQYSEEDDDEIKKSVNPKKVIKGTIYAILVVSSICCIVVYLLKPYRLFYISSIGNLIAVKCKYYDKQQLDNMISLWRKQL